MQKPAASLAAATAAGEGVEAVLRVIRIAGNDARIGVFAISAFTL